MRPPLDCYRATAQNPHMAVFDPAQPDYQDNPYTVLAVLRERDPVHRSNELGAWIITSYELCDRILHDDDAFSSDPINASGVMGQSIAATRAAVPLGHAPILGNSDDAVHTRLRAIVNRAFVPRAIEAVRPTVEDIAGGLLDALPEGPVEVMSSFIEPFVVLSVLEKLGIPAADRATFRSASRAVLAARAEGLARLPAAQAAHAVLLDMLDRWHESGEVADTTVLGTLLTAAAEAERLTPDEMLMTLIHIASAGNGPSACAIGNAILAFGANPEALIQLIEDPELLTPAVEETLRYDSATHMIARFARKPIELDRRKVRRGDMAYVVIGAANRDPAHFDNADIFDITRQNNRHLSFGKAVHFCLGAPLARVMIATALSALIARYGRFRVLNAQRGGTLLIRGPGQVVIAGE